VIALVIEKDELKKNEEGEIIGYEGEGKAIAMYLVLGIIIGTVVGTTVISPAAGQANSTSDPAPVSTERDTQLMDAEAYCKARGFDWRNYVGPNSTQSGQLSITCYPESGDSWTTYYFNLNMTKIDAEVTVKR
jgi:hypothetical protein